MKLNNIVDTVLSECTAVGIRISNQILLAKNRDRTYNPQIKIVREILDGTEVLYMYDIDTDYSEGMNEHGIGIVNTTLQGKEDEKTIKITRKHKKLSGDGHKIRHALSMHKVDDVVESLDLYRRGLGGHTIVGHKNGYVSIEKIRMGKPHISHLDKKDVVVRTNHGIYYPDQGYQSGKDRESSVSRAFHANQEARTSKSAEDLLIQLRKHHHLPGYLEPYRTNYKVWTSSQICLNLSKLEMIFVLDENTKLLGVENKLPDGYKPKIKLKLYELDTQYSVTPMDEYHIASNVRITK